MVEILIIDSDPKICELLNVNLKSFGYNLTFAQSGFEGLKKIELQPPDLVICELELNDISGVILLEKIKELDKQIQVILISEVYNVKSIIASMQKGAFDYLLKPLDIDQLQIKINRALEIQSISLSLNEYISHDQIEYDIENNIIGKSYSMRSIAKNIGQLSSNRVTVLIQGESGTGKELIAKSIHYSGISKDQPFIAVNCSALSETLIESELFGHVKGAFTDGVRDKKGKFEIAREGTIFLDEISELSLSMQAKLLRVLQEREFEKVGGNNSIKMRARILAASNKDIELLVQQKMFREDLFYRLKVFVIDVPPLRNRKEDIPLLVSYFLRKINLDLHKNVNKVPFEVMEILNAYSWPGNVRELENTLLQAVVQSKNDVLLPENIQLGNNDDTSILREDLSLEEIEKLHILKILKKVNFNKQKAIKILGISKPTLYSKLKKYKFNYNF